MGQEKYPELLHSEEFRELVEAAEIAGLNETTS